MAEIKFNPSPIESGRKPLGQTFSPSQSSELAILATHCVLKWMKENAPAHILSLWHGASTLYSFERQVHAGKGQISADSNSIIAGAVTECIKALDLLDDDWISPAP